MASRSPALDVQALTVRYPSADRDALRDVSLRVEPGAFVGVAGRNGAGQVDALPRRGRVAAAGRPGVGAGLGDR